MTKRINFRYRSVVIGVSAGGLSALTRILPRLDKGLGLSVLIVQHLGTASDDFLVRHFRQMCRLAVVEAEDKAPIEPGTIYFAPPNYHLLVEPDQTIALSTEGPVNYSRPSIDLLFESAADAFGQALIGVILTGANSDGSRGMARIKRKGGLAIVQSPETAEADAMPKAALNRADIDLILSLDQISNHINQLSLQELP